LSFKMQNSKSKMKNYGILHFELLIVNFELSTLNFL